MAKNIKNIIPEDVIFEIIDAELDGPIVFSFLRLWTHAVRVCAEIDSMLILTEKEFPYPEQTIELPLQKTYLCSNVKEDVQDCQATIGTLVERLESIVCRLMYMNDNKDAKVWAPLWKQMMIIKEQRAQNSYITKKESNECK